MHQRHFIFVFSLFKSVVDSRRKIQIASFMKALEYMSHSNLKKGSSFIFTTLAEGISN